MITAIALRLLSHKSNQKISRRSVCLQNTHSVASNKESPKRKQIWRTNTLTATIVYTVSQLLTAIFPTMPIHHSYDNEKIWLRRVHWTSRLRWNQDAGGNLRGIYGSYSNLPTRGKEALERDHQHESNMSSPLSMRDMPMQATPSPWCLVLALQLAEYTEGIRCDRAFSVVQGTGKGCTIRQDCLVGFKDHGQSEMCNCRGYGELT